MGKDGYGITLHKNLQRRLKEEEAMFNRFVMEPVEESKELALIEEEKKSMIELEVNYSLETSEIDYENKDIVDVECIAVEKEEKEEKDFYEKKIKELLEENSKLKSDLYSLTKENKKIEMLLTKEQKLLFYQEDSENNKLTKAEKLLLDKREELSRRSQIRKRGWIKQVLG